jgi:hypothetical protein
MADAVHDGVKETLPHVSVCRYGKVTFCVRFLRHARSARKGAPDGLAVLT